MHLTAGAPPTVRVHGRLLALEGFPVLGPQDTREIVYSIMSDAQRQQFENLRQVDFSYSVPRTARMRVNAYVQRGAVGAAFRVIPSRTSDPAGARDAAGGRDDGDATARDRARHRPDRLGQVDHARGDDRPDQHALATSTS